MKYLTDHFSCLFALATLNSSDVFETVIFKTKTWLKLRDRGFIKNSETESRNSRMRLHHKFQNRDFKICGFCRNFSKKMTSPLPKLNFFGFLTLFRPVFIVSYLQIQQRKTRWITVLLSHIRGAARNFVREGPVTDVVRFQL